MKAEIFKDKVDLVNKELQGTEPKSIETYRLGNKEFTGYGVQYVIDAVNSVFGLDWHYDIIAESPSEGKDYWVAMQVKFKVGDEWVYKGTQYGSGSALSGDGDSRKSAISDGLKKGFALWGIGNKPYRGELVAGEGMKIKEISPLIEEVCKENKNLDILDVKKEIASYILTKYKITPQQLDNLPDDLQTFIMEELKEIVNKKRKQLI